MNRKVKAFLTAALAILLAVVLLTGCETKKKDDDDKIKPTPRPTPENLVAEIKLSGYLYSENSQNLEKFKAVYYSDYPGVEIDIDLDKVSTSLYFEVLDDLMSGDDLENAGDVILLDAQRMEYYAQQGKLIDLSAYIGDVLNFDTYKKINPSADLLPAAYNACFYNGDMYMVAMEYNHKFVLLNYSLISTAGYSFPHDDWTWDDLIEIAEAVKEMGVETPIAMNYKDYAIWGAFARSYGQDVYDYVGNSQSVKELNLTHPDVVSGLEDLAEIVNPERGLVECIDSKDIAPEDISKYAFIIADHEDIATWSETLLAAEDPETEGEKWEWDYIHFPRWNDENYDENGVYYQAIAANVYGFAVVNHGKSEFYNDDFYRACAYLALYATVTEAAKSYALDGQAVPANKAANAQKFWREYPKAGKNSSVFSNFAETADFAGSLGCFMPVMSANEIDISYAIDGYLSGERTMIESLQELQEKAQAGWITR
ncbi:MAG: extracellular solute-binding protein [Clostridia bacterium]|nr:extracellular solute-binding protein [Clostridia bacterium]